MRLSKYVLPSLKETPSDAVLPSHRLMLRAGLIRKASSGFYTYLPFGLKVLRKVEAIVREEMDGAGGQEFLFPLLISRDLWEATGRWDVFKGELFRLMDRGEGHYALGPTHEESFTDFFKQEISSYRDLPLLLYQIATKFRDEIRPRYGVMRSKEFLMKDAYSFHLDEASLDTTYRLMSETYSRIFKRLGLDFVHVKADSGAMGGQDSEEFMVKSEVGEETIIHCANCGYAANIETAGEKIANAKAPEQPLAEIHTPNTKTIPAIATLLNLPENKLIRSLLFDITFPPKKEAGATPSAKTIMVLIRGDYNVNMVKLHNAFPHGDIALTPAEKVLELTGSPVGFVGPVKLKTELEVIADVSLKNLSDGVSGANREDYHLKGISMARDVKATYGDLYQARAGGACPTCGDVLESFKGIEVGHIFKLGKKYTEAFAATVLDEKGKATLPTMGCYGIGINRTLAAIIEQHHDHNGIKWPRAVSPFDIHLLTLNTKDETSWEFSKKLYEDLSQIGWSVLWDDRDERAGFKFKEADLLGLPLQIVIGPKSLSQGEVEVQFRESGEKKKVATKELVSCLQNAFVPVAPEKGPLK